MKSLLAERAVARKKRELIAECKAIAAMDPPPIIRLSGKKISLEVLFTYTLFVLEFLRDPEF